MNKVEVVEYINNSISIFPLYKLMQEMKQNGSMYWANRIEEIINLEVNNAK